jgi:hypothetical protein
VWYAEVFKLPKSHCASNWFPSKHVFLIRTNQKHVLCQNPKTGGHDLTAKNILFFPSFERTCGRFLKNLSWVVALSLSYATSFAQDLKTFSITEQPRLHSNLELRLNSIFKNPPQRPILNFAPRGRLSPQWWTCPPRANLFLWGWSYPLGWNFLFTPPIF